MDKVHDQSRKEVKIILSHYYQGMEKPKRKYLWLRKILLVLLVLLIAIQFIRPEKNNGEALGDKDISKVVPVSNEVMGILKTSCFDCHSNYTDYPWYAHVNPIGFWLADHIAEGKHHLNFTEFAALELRKQKKKLEEVVEMVEDGEMPLESYVFIHRDAVLTKAQQTLLVNWAKESRMYLDSSR